MTIIKILRKHVTIVCPNGLDFLHNSYDSLETVQWYNITLYNSIESPDQNKIVECKQ